MPNECFFRKLKQLLLRPDETEEPSIKYLFGLLFRRTKIVYTAQHKMRLAKEISQLLLNQGRKKMIAFFERIQSAEDFQEDLAVETAEELKRELEAVHQRWIVASSIFAIPSADVSLGTRSMRQGCEHSQRSIRFQFDLPTPPAGC